MNVHWLVHDAPDVVQSRLALDGDTLALAVTREGNALIECEIDPTQAWFWSREWQAGERAADAQGASGHGTMYYNDSELLAALEADLKFS